MPWKCRMMLLSIILKILGMGYNCWVLYFEHGQSSDPNTASLSRSLEIDVGPFTNVEDEPLGGSSHISPPRSTQAPPTGQPSGGAEDPITLTALSSVVSTLVQKKWKMVVSDFDQEDGGKQDVDLDALRALANAAVTVDSNIPPGGAFHIPAASTSVPVAVPTGASTVPAGSPSVPVNVPPSVAPVGVSNKGKSLMVEEYIHVKARTLKHMEEDILGEKAAKRWSMARVKSFTDAQLKEEFEKIQKAISNIQIQAFSQTLKRTGLVLEEPSSKRQKSTKAPFPSVPEVTQSSVVSLHTSSGIRRNSLTKKHLTNPSDIDALYRIDQSTKHFSTLRQILHMVDRQELVLFDSHDGGKGSYVWQHQHLWEIRSWRLYTLSNVHVLETVSGEVLYMFADVSYPLSVKLMEKILRHKLEIDKDVVGNDMTIAEQLIQFIKN
nr:aminoacyl-tRNA synthetase, class 1a, anticodon-binding [Tanacetum cinerariifolium]